MTPNEIISLASLVASVLMTMVGLATKSAVSTWRAEAQAERAEDKDDLRKWIEDKFLPSREADARLIRMESSHQELSRRVDDNERRLRRVEQRRRNATESD